MRSAIFLTIAALFGSNAFAQNPQVNFYYDDGCSNGYGGTGYPGQGIVQGGTYGSKSAVFINSGNYPCGSHESAFKVFICADPNCAQGTQVNVGECVSFYQSVYALWNCDDG